MGVKRARKQVFHTMADIRLVARGYGGRVEKDGCGGFEVLAPDGMWWKAGEVWCQPIPLGEAESAEEKREMIATAGQMIGQGVEPAGGH